MALRPATLCNNYGPETSNLVQYYGPETCNLVQPAPYCSISKSDIRVRCMLNFLYNFRHNFRYSRYTSVFTSSPWQPCATHPCVMHSCALLMHPCAMAQLQVLQVHARFHFQLPTAPHVQPCATHPCVMHPCALFMHPCAMHHLCSLCIHHLTQSSSNKSASVQHLVTPHEYYIRFALHPFSAEHSNFHPTNQKLHPPTQNPPNPSGWN